MVLLHGSVIEIHVRTRSPIFSRSKAMHDSTVTVRLSIVGNYYTSTLCAFVAR